MLKIGIIGYNRKLTQVAMRIISENDANSIPVKSTAHSIEMSDGTVYLPIYCSENIKGNRYDQIIIADDYRWDVLYDKSRLIKEVFGILSPLFEYYGTIIRAQLYEL